MTLTEAKTTEENTINLPAEVAKVGTLGADPELRFAPTGTPFARMRIAVEHPKEPGNWAGERVTEWYEVTAFRTLAENAAESLHKGDRVLVVGKPELQDWTDKEGNGRQSKGILANALGPDLRFATASVERIKVKAKTETETTTTVADYSDEPF